jgi:hypothetical protein
MAEVEFPEMSAAASETHRLSVTAIQNLLTLPFFYVYLLRLCVLSRLCGVCR